MNTILTVISLLGGLAMFLYGMEVMGDGLKQGSGETLKKFLGRLTHNSFMGLVTGAIVTAIIQSSTATIVLTVGLIGAGILNLKQAVSIVLGANIGTTVTAQIIRLMDIESSSDSLLVFFKPDTLAPFALIIGIVLVMFIKRGYKNVGTICLGFGILFMGLISMTDAVEPLAESEAFVNIIAYFSDMPVIGIFTGLILTVIIQSSSAMVGILQALSSTGTMTFNVVYPIIMGINLGTCVTTAMVCSIGSSKDAKRTGVVHIVFNTIGTILFMIGMTILKNAGFWPELWNSIANSGVIANFQTLFNLITAIVLLPFTGWLVTLSCKIVKDDPVKEDKYPELASLDRKLMISPGVALGEVTRAVIAMANAAKDNVAMSIGQFKGYSQEVADEINRYEDRLDAFADTADNFLIELSHLIDSEKDQRHLSMLMQCVPIIERIGDYATNFDEMAKKVSDEKLDFSESAMHELSILSDAVLEILRLTIRALENDSEIAAQRIEPLEDVIDQIVLTLRGRHTDRLCQGKCSIASGLVFIDALIHLERTADQCSNIALLVLGKHNADIMNNHHGYIRDLHKSGNEAYNAEHKNREEQYLTPIRNITY